MFNFTSVSDVRPVISTFLHALFISHLCTFPPLISPFLPPPLQAVSCSTVPWLSKGKNLLTIGEEILRRNAAFSRARVE